MNNPTFEVFGDSKRFFYDVQTNDGIEKRMGLLNKACVVVSIPCKNGTIEKVAFMKTNRSRNYRDSRTPRKMIDEIEVLEELTRLLDSNEEAHKAFVALQV